jgi:tetratricopeptide (TPR) repeat protein
MKFSACTLIIVLTLSLGTESRKGKVEQVTETQLAKGYWMVLMASQQCKNCIKVKRLLVKVADEFYPQIMFGHMDHNETKRYGISRNAIAGKLLLFPNQGSMRYIPYNENQTVKDVKFFLRYYLAENARSQAQIDKAIDEFNLALHHRPTSGVVHLNLAILHHQERHDLVTAARHYDQAFTDEASLPSLSQAHYMAGNAYLTLGYPKKARKHYDNAVKSDPKLYGAYREAAIAAGMQNDANASEAALRKAISIRPDDPDSLVDLASLLLDRFPVTADAVYCTSISARV